MRRQIYIAYDFIIGLYRQRRIIGELAQRDFKKSYLTHYLGITWAFLQPLITFAVIYFVFAVGLKGNREVDGVPFIAYLLCGTISYSYLSSVISSGIGSFKEYNFLVKKVDISPKANTI